MQNSTCKSIFITKYLCSAAPEYTSQQDMSKPTVLVTGANGYIAQHIVRILIDNQYIVIGTVRSQDKGTKLQRIINSPNFKFVVVKDIAAPGAFDDVLKSNPSITSVLHTASPFAFDVEDPERDILIPAIQGTKNILHSIVTHAPQVKKLVITSSSAAARPELESPDCIANEDTWSMIDYDIAKENSILAYLASKPLAEKAAWDFVKQNKPNFTLSTILPGYTWGPQLALEDAKPEKLNTSVEVIDLVVNSNENSKLIKHIGPYIDVRDVAKAHKIALENPETDGKRLLLVSGQFTMQTIADIVRKNFPELKTWKGYPGGDKYKLRKLAKYDFSRTQKLLNIEYYPIEQTVVDTVAQILKARGAKL